MASVPGTSASNIGQSTSSTAHNLIATVAPTQYGMEEFCPIFIWYNETLSIDLPGPVVPRNFNPVDPNNDYTLFVTSQATWSE